MSTISKNQTMQSAFACKVIIDEAVATKPTEQAKKLFSSKPFYMEYNKETKEYDF